MGEFGFTEWFIFIVCILGLIVGKFFIPRSSNN